MTTNPSGDRLDRIELLLEQTGQRLEENLTTLNEGVVNLLARFDDDRPTILRKLNSIENKVDRLLGGE